MNTFVDRLLELDMGVEIVAVADVDLPKTKSLLAAKGLDSFSMQYFMDADEMLDSISLDGVMIGTRCTLHTEMAVKVMKRNIPLFLEKPVATTPEELARLRLASAQSTSETVVSFPLRFTPLVRLVKDIVDSGKLGTVEHVQAVNNVPYGGVYYHSWYRDDSLTGGLFLQKATHDLDYINYLLGLRPTVISAMQSKRVFKGNKPANLACVDCEEYRSCPESPYVLKNFKHEEVTGDMCSFAVDTGNHDSASLMIRYESGMHAIYSQNFYARKSAALRGARLIGYNGTAEFDWYRDEVSVFMHHTPRVETYRLETAKLPHFGGDTALAQNFIGVLLGREKSQAPLSSGILSALMCMKAEKSAVTDTFQNIESVEAQ